MAELVDAQDLGSCGETRGGSSPSTRTIFLPSTTGIQECISVFGKALMFGNGEISFNPFW